MADSGVDVRSYFEPEDIAALGTFESGHYWHLPRRKVVLKRCPVSEGTSACSTSAAGRVRRRRSSTGTATRSTTPTCTTRR